MVACPLDDLERMLFLLDGKTSLTIAMTYPSDLWVPFDIIHIRGSLRMIYFLSAPFRKAVVTLRSGIWVWLRKSTISQ